MLDLILAGADIKVFCFDFTRPDGRGDGPGMGLGDRTNRCAGTCTGQGSISRSGTGAGHNGAGAGIIHRAFTGASLRRGGAGHGDAPGAGVGTRRGFALTRYDLSYTCWK